MISKLWRYGVAGAEAGSRAQTKRRLKWQIALLAGMVCLLFLAGCGEDETPTPAVTPTAVASSTRTTASTAETGTAVALEARAATATAATRTPTPTATATAPPTATPRVTITPNAPGIIGQVVYAQPPRASGFSRPAANVPSTLKIVNQTSVPLLVTLLGVSDAAAVSPDGFTEWQVVPGSYTYNVVAELGGLAFLQDDVAVGPGEIVTITIDELAFSQLVFINQTSLTLSISLPEANKSFSLGAGQTSEAIVLPPGDYSYTASALGTAPYQDSVSLDAGESIEITLIASEVFGNSSVTLINQTNFSVRLTVDSVGAAVVANAGGRSEPLYLPPGSYDYTVCDSASGAVCGNGSFTINAGVNVEVVVDETVISTSAVRFENQTPYALVIAVDGVTSGVTVPAGTTSNPIDVLPGTYTYRASGENVAPLSDTFTVATGEELTVTLVITGTRAMLTIINETTCTLTVNLNGPNTFSFSVPANQSKTVDIQDGSYTYTITACNASTGGSFSGSQEIRIFFE